MSILHNRASELAQLMMSFEQKDGIHPTKIPRVSIIRSSKPTDPVHVVHNPAVCIVVQGAKKVILGDRVFEYGAAKYLAASVDVPISGQVTEASQDLPYMCFKLDLDLKIMSDVFLNYDIPTSNKLVKNCGVGVSNVNERLLDSALRLISLVDYPEDIEALAPLAEQEILYWLAKGEQGAIIHQIANKDSRLRQVYKAINHIKISFDQPFNMNELLEVANMSSATFFQHFRTTTNMTPLQYQKQLRLQEARRLMFLNEMDVSGAGFKVGYESPSQFSREYSRLFGLAPSKDMERIKSKWDLERKFL